MANALVIGTEDGLLEGLAQALHAAGHRALIARSLDDAAALLAVERPVVVIVERSCAATAEFLRLRRPAGSALVVYRDADAETPPLPSLVQRATLADLVLPWERQRLITLVHRVSERAQAAGRGRDDDTPTENRIV